MDRLGKVNMWVFGYGSLMGDGWEEKYGCVRRAKAEVRGYRRVFNKASVRNWGSNQYPCPTLNLVKSKSATCHGIAFEFPDDRKREIREYLTKREGKDFSLRKLPAQLDQGDEITAIVPIYEGNNLIPVSSVDKIVQMTIRANGKDGACVDYVKGIAEELRRLGIDDPAVSELWHVLVRPEEKPRPS